MQGQQQRSLTPISIEEWADTYYPLISKRKKPIPSLVSALKDTNSLVDIDKKFEEGLALQWVKAELLDTFWLLGAGNSVNSNQAVFMARRIRNIYYYLSLSELTYFFESLIGGGYGKIYVGNTINPQNLMEALQKFDTERAQILSQMESDANKERKKDVRTDLSIVNAICSKLGKELAKSLIGSKAGHEYKPFNANKKIQQ